MIASFQKLEKKYVQGDVLEKSKDTLAHEGNKVAEVNGVETVRQAFLKNRK